MKVISVEGGIIVQVLFNLNNFVMTTCRNFTHKIVTIFQNIYSESANVNIKDEHADRK